MRGHRRALILLAALAVVVGACSGGSTGAEPADVSQGPSDATGPGLTAAEQAELDEAIEAFLTTPTAIGADPVVELMARSGELRYAPWLLDLVQLSLSNLLNRDIVETLADLTGEEASAQTFRDFGRFGGLIETWGVDGGEGYREWKTTLFARFDDEFGALLDSVDDDEQFTRIRFGGVPRGGIPELNQPERIDAEAAGGWITDDEIVLGVAIDGEVVAYPFRFVGHHELVNDEVAGIPVALAYCTLCRTGLLFDRRVGDLVLDFETSGLLINSNKIMVDRQTDTLWHHTAGTAIGGPLDGTLLELLPLETTTWAEWVAEHPGTEVIDRPEPFFFDDPERPAISYPYEAEGPYASYYESDTTLFPIRQAPDTFDNKADVVGVETAGGALAIELASLADGSPRFFPVASSGVVVVPTDRGARVYDGAGSSMIAAGAPAGAIVEVERFDGDEAVLGDGSTVTRLTADLWFWFAWWELHPDTTAWPSP